MQGRLVLLDVALAGLDELVRVVDLLLDAEPIAELAKPESKDAAPDLFGLDEVVTNAQEHVAHPSCPRTGPLGYCLALHVPSVFD
jgi:hypothetical protein